MNTTKILLVFVAEFPWKWYIDLQANLAKDLKPHACIPKDAQDEGFSTNTVTTVTMLTFHGLDVGAQSTMKKKILSWCIWYSKNSSIKKLCSNFFYLFSPIYLCLVHLYKYTFRRYTYISVWHTQGINPNLFIQESQYILLFLLQNYYLFASTHWFSLNFSKFPVSSLKRYLCTGD